MKPTKILSAALLGVALVLSACSPSVSADWKKSEQDTTEMVHLLKCAVDKYPNYRSNPIQAEKIVALLNDSLENLCPRDSVDFMRLVGPLKLRDFSSALNVGYILYFDAYCDYRTYDPAYAYAHASLDFFYGVTREDAEKYEDLVEGAYYAVKGSIVMRGDTAALKSYDSLSLGGYDIEIDTIYRVAIQDYKSAL